MYLTLNQFRFLCHNFHFEVCLLILHLEKSIMFADQRMSNQGCPESIQSQQLRKMWKCNMQPKESHVTTLRNNLFSRHCIVWKSWTLKINKNILFYSTTNFLKPDISRPPNNLRTNNIFKVAYNALWDPDLPHQPHSCHVPLLSAAQASLIPWICPDFSCHKAFANTIPSAWNSLPPTSLPKSSSS